MKRWLFSILVLREILAYGDTLVVPSHYANVDAPAAGGLPGFGFQYQEVFDSSGFLNIAAGGVFITGFSWRPDNPPGGGNGNEFDLTFPSVEISASTTSHSSTSLSPVFSENIGADQSLVRTAAPVHMTGSHPQSGPSPFSITFSFDKPFRYDPTKGNLLLEVHGTGGGISPGNLDYSNVREGVGLVVGTNPSNPAVDYGPITQFTFVVPEPEIWQLGIFAAAMTLPITRRNSSKEAI